MCRLISFGGYNKLYKYIWIYLIMSLIIKLFYSPRNERIIIIDFPQDIIIQQIFDHLGIFIISLLLYIYFFWRKNENDNKKTISENDFSSTKSLSSQINFIYNENEGIRHFSIKQFLILVILLFLSMQLFNTFSNVGL